MSDEYNSPSARKANEDLDGFSLRVGEQNLVAELSEQFDSIEHEHALHLPAHS